MKILYLINSKINNTVNRMNQIVMSIKKKEFKEFLSNIVDMVGTNRDDMDMLRWIVEDTYDEKFKVNLDYFKDNSELLVAANLELYDELDIILKKLTSLEHYEKCAVIKSCMDNFLLAFRCK